MYIDIVSDTESRQDSLSLNGGDILIHCGDATRMGTPSELREFLYWFGKQPYEYKIYVPGNRDRALDYLCDEQLYAPGTYKNMGEWRIAVISRFLHEDVKRHILIDSYVKIKGLNIYGSPITQCSKQNTINTAFATTNISNIVKRFANIPKEMDIVITHTPVYGILDYIPNIGNVGNRELGEALLKVSPRVHVCGHIHPSYGYMFKNKTLHINAAMDKTSVLTHKVKTLYFNKLNNIIEIT